ncbi:MAG: hypothetical protein CM1200mP1_05190 [Candidatus Neomarinimicrobiota bacterium]|nr:MAG: hypothetical protein CM1200mP1_05190 [Candidatus Neomarinimicrobiota bacterium]
MIHIYRTVFFMSFSCVYKRTRSIGHQKSRIYANSYKNIWGENGIEKKMNLAPETRKKELELRVKMLQTHQKLALVSLGLLPYQYSLGPLNSRW